MATLMIPLPHVWAQVEPQEEGGDNEHDIAHSCYSKILKASLVPGTFVLIGTTSTRPATNNAVVARIVKAVGGGPSFLVEVNIFKRLSDVIAGEDGDAAMLLPQGIVANHLRRIPEVVQTTEVRMIPMVDISNLAFVFTDAALRDTSNLYFICQGMAIAFLLRFRIIRNDGDDNDSRDRSGGVSFTNIPIKQCLPFPSNYENAKFHDCFPRRVWNNIVAVKLQMTRLLGRYSQQQGLYGRESARIDITAETWGFICLQCSDILCTSAPVSSTRIRVHRVVESGLIVKAARVKKVCTILRFATKSELRGLCRVFGESTTAGQRCRLPKSSEPKMLWINDIINVVCGSDDGESGFTPRTAHDGIDLEFDGLSELYITIRYSRYAFTTRTSRGLEGGCDPLLSALICHSNPYENAGDEDDPIVVADNNDNAIFEDSEFEDDDGRLYQVVQINATNVVATCIYPRLGNDMYGSNKVFNAVLVKDLIQQRLTG